MKIVVSVKICKFFTELYFFYRLLVVSCNFNRYSVCFQSFMNIACRSTQNSASIKRFLRLRIVIKPLNKKINILNSSLYWSVTLLMFIQKLITARTANLALVKSENRLAVYWVILEIFWSFVKSPRLIVLNIKWVQFVLNNCEILHSVRGFYDTAPHKTVSPQMWGIKSIKGWFYTPPDLLARFCKVNLSNEKNSAWFVFRSQ